MPDDLAFDVGEERLASIARRESLDVVRAEVVEKRLPIGAGDGDARPIR